MLYAETLEGLLKQGIIPDELIDDPVPKTTETIQLWAKEYMRNVSVSKSDVVLLNSMHEDMALWQVNDVPPG